jgi:site-specific DNA recombinase
MITDIEAGYINIVAVKDLSRLGRNHLQLGYYTDMFFPEHKVTFVSVLDEIDTSVRVDDLAPIKNFVNEMQARHISQSTKHSLRALAEAGQFMGAYAPYGYRLQTNNHHKLYIDPKAAQIVRSMYAWCIAGDGFTKIAKKLNERGVLCPTDYLNKNQPFFYSSTYHNRYHEWNMTSVRMILTNPVYKGMLVQNRRTSSTFKGHRQTKTPPETWSIKEHTHRAIVDEPSWDLAQEAIAKRRNVGAEDRRTRHDYVGLFRCHECGAAMVYSEHGTKCYFQCGTNHRKGGCYCSAHYISLFDLEEEVLAQIKKFAKMCADNQSEAQLQLSQRIYKQYSSSNSLLDGKIERLEKSIKDVNRCIIEAFDNVYSKTIPMSRYKQLMGKFEPQLDNLEKELESTVKQRVDVDGLLNQVGEFIIIARHYRYVKELDADVLHALVERIDLTEKVMENGKKKKLLIYFKYVGLLTWKGRWWA